MQIIEKKQALVSSVAKGQLMVNLPKRYAELMKVEKRTPITLTLLENGQLIIEKAKQEE